MVTKETSETLFIGKLAMASVTGFMHRKPRRGELDPVRNEQTGFSHGFSSIAFSMKFCSFQNDLPDLPEVWSQFGLWHLPRTGYRCETWSRKRVVRFYSFEGDRKLSNLE